MIRESKEFIHWNYFLSIEDDVDNLARYVEFTEDNFNTYSIEMVRLLLSSSSEVDVVAKLLCKKNNKNSKADNINEYKKLINPTYPMLKSLNVSIPKYGLTLTPWSNWSGKTNPIWWTMYNKVKHERDKNYKSANLKNTLNSIGGLYLILLLFYYEDYVEGNLLPGTTLFKVDESFV